jgi:hypothetical protein
MTPTFAQLALCIGIGCAVACAQDPTPPKPLLPDTARSGTLGSYLETAFQKQLGVCISGSPTPKPLTLTKGLSHKDVSAIPPALTDPSLKIGGDISIGFDASVGRTFAYIYPSQAILTTTPDVNNYVIADYLEDPHLLTTSGLDKTVYDFSCSASIAASMKVNSKWAFPPADVSAAISGDLNSKATYHLSLVSGVFYSPLWQQYNSTIDTDWRTYARMLLWEWYSRYPGAASDGSQRYLLTQFNGLSLYRIMTSSFSTDGKVDSSVALNMPVVSVQGQIQASFNSTSQASVESFGILVRHADGAATEDDHFEPLPKLAELAKRISGSGKSHLDKDTDHTLFQTTSHNQIINGIPPVICTGPWTIDPAVTPNGTLTTLGTPIPVPSTDVKVAPSCKLTIAYQLNAPPAATAKETLTYSLASSIQDAAGSTIATIKFAAEPVSLSASGKPSIGNTSSTGIPGPPDTKSLPGTDDTLFTYDWTLNYPVAEDSATPERIASVAADVLDSHLKCENVNEIVPLTAHASFSAGQLTVMIEHRNKESKETLDYTKFSRGCIFNGKVALSLNNGVAVIAVIPDTQIYYSPVKVPAPAPAAPVAPAPAAGPPPPGPATNH